MPSTKTAPKPKTVDTNDYVTLLKGATRVVTVDLPLYEGS